MTQQPPAPSIIDHAIRQQVLSDDLRTLHRDVAGDVFLLARALTLALREELERRQTVGASS